MMLLFRVRVRVRARVRVKRGGGRGRRRKHTVGVEDIDLGQREGQAEGVEEVSRGRQGRLEEEVRLAGQELADVALVFGEEGADGVAVGLGAVEDGDQVVGEGDHGSAADGARVDGGADGVIEVHRSVRRQGRVGSHGTGGHEGFGAVQGQVDAEGLYDRHQSALRTGSGEL